MKNKIFYVQRVEGNNITSTASRKLPSGEEQYLYYDTTIECCCRIKTKMWRYLLKSSKKRTLKLFRLQYD